MYGFVEVGVVVDDDGVLAAHLAHHALYLSLFGLHLRSLLDDGQTHSLAARKRDLGYARMGHQGTTHLFTKAGQEVKYIFWKASSLHFFI